MRVRGHTYLGECRPFVSNGLALGAELFALPDGRHKLFLTPPGQERRAERDHEHATRVMYKDMGRNRARFIGMYIGSTLRGCGLSVPLIEFAREHIEEQGFKFDGTDRIHKPGIALALVRCGFRAEHTRCIAEIMGSRGKYPDTPDIRFVCNELQPWQMRSGNGYHEFYRVVDPGEYPADQPVNVDRAVALHTRYLTPLPHIEVAQTVPAELATAGQSA
jgi:predicted GNAT family acetyltransferase